LTSWIGDLRVSDTVLLNNLLLKYLQSVMTEKNLTPMMEQYYKAKAESKGCILFFRMGDFYEMFEDDAEVCSKVLGLALTSRAKGANAVPMAGIPCKALDSYLSKMIHAGYKVAICEQTEEASEAVGRIVERGITRIVTPGTILEENILNKKENNFLLAIQPGKQKTGLAWVDISTSLFHCYEIKTDRVVDHIYFLQPVEILIDEQLTIPEHSFLKGCQQSLKTVVTQRPSKDFQSRNAQRKLLEHFKVNSLEGFGIEGMTLSILAAGAILSYLEETHRQSLESLLKIVPFQEKSSLKLDRATVHCLELIETIRGGSREGSILQVLDETKTAMGARRLKNWILSPLADYDLIVERQTAITELMQNHRLREDLRQHLDSIYDLERISARICGEQASPRDLLALEGSLQHTPEINKVLQAAESPLLSNLAKHFDPLQDIQELIAKTIREDAPQNLKEGDLLKKGFDPALDELIQLCEQGLEWMARFQAQEIEKHGIPIKVGYNRVFGYYIEITNSHKHKIPAEYHIQQTLKNGQRCFTTELKEYESKVLGAEEERKEREYQLYLEIRKKVAQEAVRLQKLADHCSFLDVLCSLASIAVEHDYVMPTLSRKSEIRIEEGKHPVLARLLKGNECVPNPTLLESEENQIIILTGPNMSGKSTYIRQVALLVLLTHMGAPIPAKSATIGLVDRVFTRIGSGDELVKGNSTFMVEMNETANILNNATDKSLIILDEVGRGTSTFDGVAMAWAITEYISKQLKSLTLFATHYHELIELVDHLPRIRNYSVAVREWGEEILFLHHIIEGSTDRSYGIHVARLAGIPKKVIERSKEILARLEMKEELSPEKPKGPQQLNLFDAPKPHRVLESIRVLDLDRMAPMEAWMKLREFQQELRSS
jgi:DNA mismatch repair protein MutS